MAAATPSRIVAPMTAEHPDTAASGELNGRAYLQLVGLGALIGVPAALVAAAFLALVHFVENWLWDELPHALGSDQPPWYLLVGLPILGAAIVAAARLALPGDGGASPLGGLNEGPVPVSHVPGIMLAALGTLAFGAVLGPEMPVIALGSAVGVAAASLASVIGRRRAVLGMAGSFSAVSALFGGPLVGGMLLLEGGLAAGSGLLPLLLPGLVAAAVGYVLFVGLGAWTGLPTTGLAVPDLPVYPGTRFLDLGIAILVGVAVALLIKAVHALASTVDTWSAGRARSVVVLLAGGAATGLLALVVQLLGSDGQAELFSGQSAVPELVAQTALLPVLLLVAAKAIGYGICLGCGFRGGPVFPSIFLGVGLCAIAMVGLGVSPTVTIAIGAAAGMAAQTRLLFAPVLFAALLVGRPGLDTISAAVLGAAAAWLTSAVLDDLGKRRADRKRGTAPTPQAVPGRDA
jgi:H+/Cl- antiporter ClcA